MFERFATEARDVVQRAHARAAQAGNHAVDPEDLLVALALDASTSAGRTLASLGLDEATLDDAVAQDVEDLLSSVGVVAELPGAALLVSRPRFAPATKRALEGALRVAVARSDRHIDSRHLLLALLSPPRGRVAQVLARAGVEADTLRASAAEAQ